MLRQLQMQIAVTYVAAQDYYPNIRVGTFLKAVYGFYAQWDASKAAQYLSSFGIDPSKKISQLSTGMRVKLSFAVALSHSAEIFILDEPTTGLDPIVREQVLEILKRLAEEKDACILFSSHITQDIEKIASRILFLVDGTMALDTEPKALSENYVKLCLDDSLTQLEQVRQKGVVLSDGFVILKKSDADEAEIGLYESKPVRIEDVLILLNGGVNDDPAD